MPNNPNKHVNRRNIKTLPPKELVIDIVDDDCDDIPLEIREAITLAVVAALGTHKLFCGEVSVSLVPAQDIRALNAEYRGKDAVTDVLSFQQYESLDDIRKERYPYYGDVVICVERAKEQAQEFGHTFERELLYLTVHSVLHLLGYDHEDELERAEMRAAEKAIMKQIGVFKTKR